MPVPGPLELVLILVIVAMLFGVGKLPEVFGSVGKGIREFRKEASIEPKDTDTTNTAAATPATTPAAPAAAAPAPVVEATVDSAGNGQAA